MPLLWLTTISSLKAHFSIHFVYSSYVQPFIISTVIEFIKKSEKVQSCGKFMTAYVFAVCNLTSPCQGKAACQNVSESLQCQCSSGYTGDGLTTCSDIDESASTLGECNGNATCRNTIPDADCTCKKDYTGEGKTCTDIDECSNVTTATLTLSAPTGCPGFRVLALAVSRVAVQRVLTPTNA